MMQNPPRPTSPRNRWREVFLRPLSLRPKAAHLSQQQPEPGPSLVELQQAVQAMSARLDLLTASVQQLTTLLVEFDDDEDPDPATFSLDGPVVNRTRDQDEPL